jgi:hemolysin activation/secretion protein
VRGLANDTEEFRAKRAHGTPNYFLLRSDASYSRVLPLHMSVRVRAVGQYAVDPVISNEQFSIAGADGVRGYLEAEQLGDVGIRTSLELASPPWQMLQERLGLAAFAFYDFGRMSRLEPLRGGTFGELLEAPDHTLRSAGAGVEFTAFSSLSGAIVYAYPFAVGSLDGTQEGDSRIHFVIRATW